MKVVRMAVLGCVIQAAAATPVAAQSAESRGFARAAGGAVRYAF